MVEHTSKHLASILYEVARRVYFSRHELSDNCDLDMLPRHSPSPLQQPNDDDWETPSPRIRRGSSQEMEQLLYETTV